MAAAATSHGSPTGVAETVPVLGHPGVGAVGHGTDPGKTADPGKGREPRDLRGEESQGISPAESPAVGEDELDFLRQLTGAEAEATGERGVLEGDEGKAAGCEDGIPSSFESGTDGAKGIESDPTSAGSSFSTINTHFSIHRNLRSQHVIHWSD